MAQELTNLLPEDRKRTLRRRYFLRLGTLALGALTFLVVLDAVMLLPTYIYARNEAARASAELTLLTASAENAGEAEVTARSTRLQTTATSLMDLKTQTTASAPMRAILNVPRPGIALTGFTYTAPQNANTPARMQVTGVAASRNALREYVGALGTLPFVTAADLPISAYAKEVNIDFTITLSGTLKP